MCGMNDFSNTHLFIQTGLTESAVQPESDVRVTEQLGQLGVAQRHICADLSFSPPTFVLLTLGINLLIY